MTLREDNLVRTSDGSGVTACECGTLKGKATYTVTGPHLILKSDVGDAKVLIGLQEPRRLARRLLKTLCEREAVALRSRSRQLQPGTETAPINLADKMQARIDDQCEKLAAMAVDDPHRASEASALDAMIKRAELASMGQALCEADSQPKALGRRDADPRVSVAPLPASGNQRVAS